MIESCIRTGDFMVQGGSSGKVHKIVQFFARVSTQGCALRGASGSHPFKPLR